MRHLLSLFFFTCLLACSAEPQEGSAGSGPAPGTTPSPAVVTSGKLEAGKLTAYPAEHIIDCDCRFRLDPTPAGYDEADLFFVFNWQRGGGVISLNGRDCLVQRGASLGTSGTDNIYSSYLHQSDDFNVQTSVTEEGPAEHDRRSFSGKVRVTHLKTGEKLIANVVGTCGC